MNDESGGKPSARAGEQATFTVRAQYIKDLSFENPDAPRSVAGTKPPRVELSVSVNGRELADDTHEVELKLEVRATQGDAVAFVVELTYGGVFQIGGVTESQVRPTVMTECPRFLFPFARRVIADCTREGGFPPLMLDPIDFNALFHRSEQARRGANGGQANTALN